MSKHDWRANLRHGLENLIDEAVNCGVRHGDVCAAIVEALGQLRLAYDKDPDPVDHSSEHCAEEPSNDWPAAD